MSRLRLLVRSSVNPGGINLGDRYEVISDAPSVLLGLGDAMIGVKLACCPTLESCADYRLELVTDFKTIARKVQVTAYSPPYAIFNILE